jgi:hypothetical protein
VQSAVTARLAAQHGMLGWEYTQQGHTALAREHLREAARLEPMAGRRLAVWKSYIPAPMAAALRRLRSAFGW